MAVPFLAPAAAQAGTTPSPAAHVAATRTVAHGKFGSGADPAVSCSTAAAIIDEHHGTPLWSYVPGNGNVNLYFGNSGAATYFCPVILTFANGVIEGYQFYANGTNVCLALNSSAHSIQEGSATACTNATSYTQWLLSTTDNPNYYEYQSEYNYNPTECIYDNTQRPATYTQCSKGSNQFEWLSYP